MEIQCSVCKVNATLQSNLKSNKKQICETLLNFWHYKTDIGKSQFTLWKFGLYKGQLHRHFTCKQSTTEEEKQKKNIFWHQLRL